MTESRYKRYLGIVVVVVLLGWWVQQGEDKSREFGSVDTRVPDHYFKGLTVTTMNAAGIPSHRLDAEALKYYADENMADLVKPRLFAFRDDGLVWRIQSDQAQAYSEGTSLWLQGNVELVRQPVDGAEAMTVVMQDLWVYPEREYASSDAVVVIKQGMDKTQGEGLRVDLKKGYIQLLSNVKGSYVLESR